MLPIDEAIEKRFKTDWSTYQAFEPNLKGRKILKKIPVSDIIPYIDWKFFFHSWNLSARYATVEGIDNCPSCRVAWIESFAKEEWEKASEAYNLYQDAQKLLAELVFNNAGYIRAVFGIYSAYSDNKCLYINDICFPMLRQQKKNDKDLYLSLCDFVAPLIYDRKDYVGGFTVTAGVVANELMEIYERSGDEYRVLLLKSVLDRLAEAATEWLHHKIRTEYWGFASDENLSVKDMFAVRYRSIRPAVGYPSIPDQTINFLLNHDLLHSEEIGVELTENGVMLPNASVSGIIISHPQAKYFNIGRILNDQFDLYTQHRGIDKEIMRKFLSANMV